MKTTTPSRRNSATGGLSQVFAIFLGLMIASTPASSTTPILPTYVFNDLYIGPNHELVVTHSKGIYRSINGGESWSNVLADNDFVRISKIIDGNRHGLFVVFNARLYRSMDTGLTWSHTGTGSWPLTLDRAGNLYTCLGGVKISRDFGKTWTPTKTQPLLPTPDAQCLTMISSGKGLYVFSGGEKGAASASMNQGRSWKILQGFSDQLQDKEWVKYERVLADSEGALYVNTLRAGELSESRLYRGSRGGQQWDEIRLDDSEHGNFKTEVVAIRGTTIFARCHWYAAVLCISDGKSPVRIVDFRNTGFLNNFGSEIRLGPNAELYEVYDYGVQRADPETMKVWSLGTTGIPDPDTGL